MFHSVYVFCLTQNNRFNTHLIVVLLLVLYFPCCLLASGHLSISYDGLYPVPILDLITLLYYVKKLSICRFNSFKSPSVIHTSTDVTCFNRGAASCNGISHSLLNRSSEFLCMRSVLYMGHKVFMCNTTYFVTV